MMINNYMADNKDLSYLPKDLHIYDKLHRLRFICLPERFIKNLENVLLKYQISLIIRLCGKYVSCF